MKRKHYITGFLVFTVLATSFLPVFAPKTKALFGGGIVFDPTVNMSIIFNTGLELANMAARAIAQAILQRMIESTVDWANTGFEGNPAYVTSPENFFTNIADDIAGELIAGSDLGYLCSPFQDQIRISLQQNYINQGDWSPQNRYQCTLTDVVGNIEGFYDDFNQGGWQGWFSMTQSSSNNPYGAYLEAQMDLDERIAKRLDLQREQLNWDSGFLAWSECVRNDPDTGICIERGSTRTPGSVIAEQVNRVLPSTMDRFINAQNLEDLVAAFVTGALNRYVFSSSDGLFSSSPPPARVPPGPPPPTSGAPAMQACMNTCINLYCPTYDPDSASCNQPALNRCMSNCAGFSGPGVPGPGPGIPGPGLPTVMLNAERIALPFFTFASLDWTSTNATSCNASGNWFGAKALSGNETIRVTDPVFTFVLTCFNANGNVSQSVSVQR